MLSKDEKRTKISKCDLRLAIFVNRKTQAQNRNWSLKDLKNPFHLVSDPAAFGQEPKGRLSSQNNRSITKIFKS